MFTNHKKTARMVLSDGTEFKGVSVGIDGTTIGEVVFNTSMTGYLETLTDSSYYGQIVVQTFPLIGNYGVNFLDYEGKTPKIAGYVVRECCEQVSIFGNEENLACWLKKNKIVAIQGVDTRALTKKIRENGVLNGAITTETIENKEELLNKIRNFKIKNAVEKCSTKNVEILNSNEKKAQNITICVLDYGIKKSIVKNLLKHAKKVVVMPYNTKKEEIEKIKPNGIVLSNGPGNPKDCVDLIENLKHIISLKIPMFGICLGHQLLALANNATTKKLKYGHRGANQPVLDSTSNRILITSQNHGFCVDKSSLNKNIAKISHTNLNDGSCEGIEYLNIPAFSVQFHPEACAGPLDTNFLFENFFKLIAKLNF